MTDQERIARGDQAKAILNSDMFKEGLATLEKRYVEAWKAAPTVDLRERAHIAVRMIEWFSSDLQSVITTGDIAQRRIDELGGKPIPIAEFRR